MKPAGRRQKGKRVELEVVHEFRNDGYMAARIPFSGAGHEKGDVKVEIPGTRTGEQFNMASFWNVEVKARAKEFDSIYKLVDMFLEKKENHHLMIIIGTVKAYIAYSFRSLPGFDKSRDLTRFTVDFDKENISGHPARRIIGFKKTYMKDCHLLVLKGDYKPMLYITYDENHLPVSP